MNRHFSFSFPHRSSPRFCSALALLALSLGAPACELGDADEASTELGLDAAQAPLVAAAEPGATQERMELVFASRVEETDDRKIVRSEVVGEIDQDQRDRVARPYRFLDEPYVYVEEAWSRGADGGTTERGYRVWRQANTTPLKAQATSGPPTINKNVAKHVAGAGAEEILELDLKLRDFPEWNVPLAPRGTDMSPADVQAQMERRARAIAEREALFDSMAAGTVRQVEAAGGSVVARHRKGGWLSVKVPFAAFGALAKSGALARIDGPYDKTGGPEWGLGEGREAAYMDADRFLDAGYDGEEPNAGRHSYGDVVIGMNESGGYESGACGFRDGAGCSSATRIAATYRCDDPDSDGNLCEPGSVDTNSSYINDEGNLVYVDSHGTATTSVALADYMDGQGNGKELNDSSWASSTCTSSADCAGQPCEAGLCAHSSTWERNRTGMAPEARAVLFGLVKSGSTEQSFTDMFDDTIDLHLDISSNSWSWGTPDCDVESSSALEDEIENAYDDGVLVVFSAGNQNGDDAASCTMSDPADTPKALAVNAYDAALADCQNNPSTRCLLDRDSCKDGAGCSARGGGDVVVAGRGLVADAVRIVDLVAPNMVTNHTTHSTPGNDGIPANSSRFAGTSAAAPHVAGLAAVVKDWYLANGQSWVNSPGRLHTIMLAMGDRHFSDDPSSGTEWTHQLAATPDYWYGVGRARLRLLENGAGMGPWANHFASYTFSGQGTVTYYPFGTEALPAGIELVKCVANHAEDMSSKSSISELKLTVNVLPNAGASCTGTPELTRISNNYDMKKVAALSGYTFTDRCVQVQIQAENVTAQGVNAQVMCYYAGVNDDESP